MTIAVHTGELQSALFRLFQLKPSSVHLRDSLVEETIWLDRPYTRPSDCRDHRLRVHSGMTETVPVPGAVTLVAQADNGLDVSPAPSASVAPQNERPAACTSQKRTKGRKNSSTERKLQTAVSQQIAKATSYRGVRQRPWVSTCACQQPQG